MKKLSNKKVALIAMTPWLLIAVLAFLNGFFYGYPPQGIVVPVILQAFIGLLVPILSFYAFVRLYKSPDKNTFVD